MPTERAAQTTASAAYVSSCSQFSNHEGIAHTFLFPTPLEAELLFRTNTFLPFFPLATFSTWRISKSSSFSTEVSCWQDVPFPFTWTWQQPLVPEWEPHAGELISGSSNEESLWFPSLLWSLNSWALCCSSSDKPIWPLKMQITDK